MAMALGTASLAMAGVSALACIPIATLNLSQNTAAPGTQLTATMQQASSKAGPITLHWNSVDGPILASAVPLDAGGLTVNFSVPQAAPGTYVVIATQDLKTGVATWGMPARAALTVSAEGQAVAPTQATAPRPEVRPAGLVRAEGPGLLVLLLVAVGAAAFGLIIVGAAVLVVGRNRAQAVGRI